MVKNCFIVLLSLLLPYLVVLGLYRYVLDYDPVYLKGVYVILGETFTETKDGLAELISIIGDSFERINGKILWMDNQLALLDLYPNVAQNPILSFLQDSGWTEFVRGIIHAVGFAIFLLFHVVDIFIVLLKISLVFVGDLADLLRVLSYFIIDSSPYVPVPYY